MRSQRFHSNGLFETDKYEWFCSSAEHTAQAVIAVEKIIKRKQKSSNLYIISSYTVIF